MLDLEERRQLAAFARWGTLSRAAEELHISQPTLSRTMQSLEEEFGVSLFVRGKHKIELNETGRRAGAAAQGLFGGAEGPGRGVRSRGPAPMPRKRLRLRARRPRQKTEQPAQMARRRSAAGRFAHLCMGTALFGKARGNKIIPGKAVAAKGKTC